MQIKHLSAAELNTRIYGMYWEWMKAKTEMSKATRYQKLKEYCQRYQEVMHEQHSRCREEGERYDA